MIYLQRYNKYNKLVKKIFCSFSTKPAVQQPLEDADSLVGVRPRKFTKKPKREPFAKNLFLGKFDTEILTYPEAVEKQDVELLEEQYQRITSYPKTNNYLDDAKQLDVHGLQANQLEGGRQFNITETCRIYEALSERQENINLLYKEELGVNLLLKLGSEIQKEKYLPSLIDGTITTAFALDENECLDLQKSNTVAKYDSRIKSWVLNGNKDYVINGSLADLFIVIAKTEFDELHKNKSLLTAFLVDRKAGDVVSQSIVGSGLEGVDVTTVTFNNVAIPDENVIGAVHGGEKVLQNVINEIRLMLGVTALTLSKQTVNRFIKLSLQRAKQNPQMLEMDIVKDKIGTMVSQVYAMESMIYLTTGMMDIYVEQDCQLECSLVRAFSSEHFTEITRECMNFLGAQCFASNNPFNKHHQNSMAVLTLHESLDSLKINLALQGIQHAGSHLQNEVMMSRNPLFNAMNTFKLMWKDRRQERDNPKLDLYLCHFLHPSLKMVSDQLEYAVLRLGYLTRVALVREGGEIVLRHALLKRFANIIIDIYAMVAVLGRASRSYCIGLQHADREMMLAAGFCVNASARIKRSLSDIDGTPYLTSDVNISKLATTALKQGDYFPIHPLTRNF